MKLERKKLIMLISITVLLVLAIIAIVVTSLVTKNGGDNSDDTDVVTPPSSESQLDDTPAVPLKDDTDVDDSESNIPPDDAYANDYSEDAGYKSLPSNFNPETSPTQDTVYDETFVYHTYNQLICELSNKYSATEKSIDPLLKFREDLRSTDTSLTTNIIKQIDYHLEWYQDNLGQRVPANKQDELRILGCDVDNLDLDDHDHH